MRKALAEFGFTHAYAVFEDNTSLWWLKCLRKGFRHCYILLMLEEGCWLELNPMSNQISVSIRKFSKGFNYISYLQKQNFTKVCEVKIKNAPLKCAPLGLFTCVEFVKRIVGIHMVAIITPYHLYKELTGCRKKILTF